MEKKMEDMSHSERASQYLDMAKDSSNILDGLIPGLEKFEEERDALEKRIDDPNSPSLTTIEQNRLEYLTRLIQFIENKVHFHYIKMLTRMEQYRIEREFENGA